MDRIRWETGHYGSQTGYIYGDARGYKPKIEVFGISYTTSRDDIKAGTPYLLAHRLPFRGVERKFGSVTEAQKHAERYLVWAFELMGFVPKDAEDYDAATEYK